MSGASGPVLEVQDLRLTFRSTQVIEQVTFQVHRGEAVALIGENGSGKTTLLRALLGWVPREAGTVEFIGCSTAPRPGQDRVGAAVGDPAFVSWMSPRSFGKMLLDSAGLADGGRVVAALDRVGLDRRAQARRFRKLSQGQRGLAALAFTMLEDPALLLLDEPFAHLDRENADRVDRLLRELVDQGRTVLYTCHRMTDLAAASRVIALVDGRTEGSWGPDDPELRELLR